MNQQWRGTLSPEYKGNMMGGQFGIDLIKIKSESQHSARGGLFYAFARSNGDVKGYVRGDLHSTAGTLKVNSNTVGGYWTHIGPTQWYIDAVLMGNFYDSDSVSARDIQASINGKSVTASLEAGKPFKLNSSLDLEAQGQAIWLHTNFDKGRDPYSTLSFDLEDNIIGRLGLRLEKNMWFKKKHLQPFLIANLWHTFNGSNHTVFNDLISLPTSYQRTALELGGGIVAKFTKHTGLYARGSYTTNLGHEEQEIAKGQLGLRIIWC